MSSGANPVHLPGPELAGPTTLDAMQEMGEMVPRTAAPRPIPAGGLVAACDVIVVLAIFFVMFIGISADRMPDGLDAFLSLRITVRNVLLIVCFASGILFVLRWVGLYDASRVRHWQGEVRRILVATVPISGMAALVPAAGHTQGPVDPTSLLMFTGGMFCALVAVRRVRARLARGPQRRRVIIVGTGPRALRIYRELCADVLTPYSVLGFVDSLDAGSTANGTFITRRTLGRLEDLERLLVGEHVDEVHIGLPVRSRYEEITETIRICEHLGVKALYQADIFDTVLAKPRVQGVTTASTPQVHLQMAPEGVLVIVKRLLDVLGAAAILSLFAPILVVAAAAIRLTSDGPVIYAQERYGLNRRRFRMFKFRTMVQDAERLQASLESRNEASGPVFKIADDPRITRVGRFLRRSSIDEFPQLFNVLRGDMSLVGPRPLPLRDVNRFTRTGDLRRFSVRPGLTCLWQISGRSGVGFDDWIALDLQYIDRWSLFLDMLILVRTIPAVVRGTGAR